MSSSEEAQRPMRDSDESLKVAIAMALSRSKLLRNPAPPPPPPLTTEHNPPTSSFHSDALKWKRKAKERKQIILRLKEDLKQAEDGLHYDLFPQTASCKCYFLDNLGKFSPKYSGDNSERRLNDVLRRRFLRQVRLNDRRKKTNDSARKQWLPDFSNENDFEHLSASVDFLVELCDTSSIQVEDTRYVSWLHQAVDFIHAALKNLLSSGVKVEPLEGIVNNLVLRLVRRMCAPVKGDEEQFDTDAQFNIQQLICKLGSVHYIGQRVIFSVSQRISVLAESLLSMDPFDYSFPSMHRSMYTMIQLIEYLVSGYLMTWTRADNFDTGLFEEWVTSLLYARKTVHLLESRNGLYILYMDRITGEVSKIVGQVSSLQKLNQDVLDNLFHSLW